MAVTKAQVAQLYVALFNRAPEGAGLNAWFAAGATKTQAQLADDMLRSPAVQSYFNGRIDTDRGFVSNIYKNFLGKDYADDPAGIESWVRHLEAGHSRGETLVKLFEVAQTPEAIAAAPVAAAIFRNKTEVSAYMAEKIADIAQRDDGTYDYEPFQAIIRGTTDTNLEEQKAKVDQLASGQTPSTNKNLTAETDNIVGTDGDDTFNGVYYVGNGAKTSTLSSLDTLDGKAGKDTLNLTVQKNGGDSDSVDMSAIEAAMRGVSNIENLNIRSEVAFSGSADINRGLDNLNIQTIGAVTISTDTKEKVSIDTTKQVQLTADEAKEVTVKAGTPTPDTELSYVKAAKATKASINLINKANTLASSSVLTEVADLTLANLTLDASLTVAKAAKISLKDVKFGAIDDKKISTDAENVELSMTYTGDNIGKVNLTAGATNKVKTLSINAKAQKSAILTIDHTKINSLTKVTVAGDAKDLTLDVKDQSNLTNFDASAFTGNFANLVIGNIANSNVVLGSGNDVVDLTGVTQLQTVDGGAGVDVVTVTAAIAKDGAGDKVTLRNFEGLKIKTPISDDIDMSKWSGFNNIVIASGASAAKSVTNILNNSTITIEKSEITSDLTLAVKEASTNTSDTLNLVFDPKDNHAGLVNTANIVVKDIETLNIDSKADDTKTSTAKNVIKLATGADTADALKSVTIKGDIATELTLDASVKKIKTLDASALEGKFTLNGTDHIVENSTIKGSATKDNDITLNATAKGSTVITGAGKDTITLVSTEKYTVNAGENDDIIKGIGSKSSSVITGGAGNDTFEINQVGNDATFPASNVATITDFARGDKIKMGDSTNTVSQTQLVKYESSRSLDFINNVQKAIEAAGNKKVAYFTYQDPDSNTTDTYIVKSGMTGNVISSDDYIVKLSGTVDLGSAKTDGDGNLTLA